jgi:hypothetical protein
MKTSYIVFPAAQEQECLNCKTKLGIDKIRANVIDTRDVYGIPAIIIRCPVCKTTIEWETRRN